MATNERERERPGLSLSDLEAVVASVRHPVLLADGEGNILWMNPAALELHGFTRVDACRLSSGEYVRAFEVRAEDRLLPPDEWPLAKAMRGEAARDLELKVRRRDTGKSWIGLYSAERLPVTGRILFTVTIQDVTERKRFEEELKESQERLAMAVDATGMGTWHAIPFGPLEGSPRFREIYGLDDRSRIDDFDSFMSHVHPDDREEHRRTVMKAIDPSGDGRFEATYRWIRPDGSVRWVAAFGKTRFGDVNGVRQSVMGAGAVLDITDRKLAEQKLAAEKERLAAALSELRSMQAQLMQSDRLASVGMLAAGVAHEINNPLSYLIAALDFVDEEARALEPLFPGGRLHEVKEALADAREGAERVRHVVRDLKTFSRGDEERCGNVDLRQVIESALNMAFNEIKYRARIARDFGPTPLVLANEARLGQVVLNLLVNAAHAIPEGHVDANEIRVATRTDERGRAVVEVRDTGSGIPPELQTRIFDPFFTTKPTGVGTGLGLAICRNIVTALGGEIRVESEVGVGTLFRVVLPPATEVVVEEDSAPEPAGAARAKRGRVLVVDDEASVCAAVRRALAPEHEVVAVTDARTARDRIAEGERFDVILCDLMMPRMTGMELHAELARLDPGQAERMVLLTGGAFTASAREFLRTVPNARVEKPFDVARLRALVRGLVA